MITLIKLNRICEELRSVGVTWDYPGLDFDLSGGYCIRSQRQRDYIRNRLRKRIRKGAYNYG